MRPSQFVSPSPRSELNGELGLDLHEIAKSLGARFADVKEKYLRMEKDNRIKGVAYTAHVDQGPIRGMVEVKSYVLSVEDAKFFVAGYNNEVGKAYRRWLIQCEKKLDQTTLLINGMMSDETICRRVLQLADEKQNALIAERDQAIRAKGQISSTREAETMGKLCFELG